MEQQCRLSTSLSVGLDHPGLNVVPGEDGLTVVDTSRKYRYVLEREWGEGDRGPLLAVLRNPLVSGVAGRDQITDDLGAVARRRGHSGLIILNVCAYVSKDPKALKNVDDPVGPLNDEILEAHIEAVQGGEMFVAWGNPTPPLLVKPILSERAQKILALARKYNVSLLCLGVTEHGNPRHPSGRSANAAVIPFLSLATYELGRR